jgi:hypothetical protein
MLPYKIDGCVTRCSTKFFSYKWLKEDLPRAQAVLLTHWATPFTTLLLFTSDNFTPQLPSASYIWLVVVKKEPLKHMFAPVATSANGTAPHIILVHTSVAF